MNILKLHRNSDPRNQPVSTSKLIINYNINYEFGSNTTEDGFNIIEEYPSYYKSTISNFEEYDKTCIGHIILPDNSLCLFSNFIIDNSLLTEVGILNNSTYKPLVRFLIDADEKFPIEGTAKLNSKGETVIYWTDFKNPQRFLNLTAPQIAIDDVLYSFQTDRLLYFPAFTTEKVELNAIIQGGGDLPTGVYIPVYKYADKEYNDTNAVFNASVVSIGDGTFFNSTYDGAPVNTISNKSIKLNIDSPDLRYAFVHLYLAYKAESSYVVYDCGYRSISNYTSFTTTISTLSTFSVVPLDAILIPRADYITAKTVTQLDSIMYWGNLKSREELNLQPYVNNIIVNPVTTQLQVQDFYHEDFRNEITIYDRKGFMYDEVYAFYASFTIEDSKGTYETKAYHIPGRKATTLRLQKYAGGTGLEVAENAPCNGTTFAGINDPYIWGSNISYANVTGGSATDISPGGEMYKVNPNAKVFHAFPTGYNVYNSASSSMAYWENSNELYPYNENWVVRNAAGTQTDDFRSTNVRHHKFPHASKSQMWIYNEEGLPDYQFHVNTTTADLTSLQYGRVNIQGVKLSNIVIPDTLGLGTVKKINVYYAKRSQNDSIILGQSIALHDGTLMKSTIAAPYTYMDATTAYGNGSNWANHIGGNIEILKQNGTSVYSNLLKNKKFIRCSPFDIVSTDSYKAPDYINVVYNISNNYRFVSDTSNSNPSTSNLMNGSFRHQWALDSANPTGGATNYPINVKRPGLEIFNRSILVSNYIESVPTYPTTDQASGNPADQAPGYRSNKEVFGTSKEINHYRADKVILMELQNDLDGHYSANPLLNTQQKTFAYNQGDTSDNGTSLDSNNLITTPSEIYLVNLCSFNTDMYVNFDTLELAFAGSSNISVIQDTDTIQGGDTFSNFYGYSSSSDTAAAWNWMLDWGQRWQSFELKFLHCFICQSVSNINYRNRGGSTYNTYYPFTSAAALLANPLMPNGEANYYDYNKAYSSVNDLKQPVIGPIIPLVPNNLFPTRVIRTAKDNVESVYDNYRVVLANDYLDLPKDKGSIWSLKGAFNKLSIFFEKTYMETMGRERILTENSESYVGAGDIFTVPPKDIVTTDGGFAGTKSQWAINITPYGLFYVDIDRGKVFLKSGPSTTSNGLDEISAEDLFYFFRDECNFTFYNSVRDMFNNPISNVIPLYIYNNPYTKGDTVRFENAYYKSLVTTANSIYIPTNNPAFWEFLYTTENIPLVGLDSIHYGFVSTYDPRYKRIILNKTDLVVTNALIDEFIGIYNTDITLFLNGLYFKDGCIQRCTNVSSQVFKPISYNSEVYFTKSQWTLSYYPEYKAWGSFYTYYPETIFNSNDTVYSTKGYKLYEHSKQILPIFYSNVPETSTIEATFNTNPEVIKEFKSIQFKTKATKTSDGLESQEYLQTFDSYQVYDSYQLSNKTTLTNLVNARNLEGFWSINSFRDYFANGSNIFGKGWFMPFVTNAVKAWQTLKRIVDSWATVRFEYNNNKVETIPYNTSATRTIAQVNQSANFDYYGYLTITTTTIPLYVGDWITITFIDNLGALATFFGQIYSAGSGIYGVKFRTPLKQSDAAGIILSLTRTKSIKLALLDITSTFIKNVR
jgi:hypothetical protein